MDFGLVVELDFGDGLWFGGGMGFCGGMGCVKFWVCGWWWEERFQAKLENAF